MTYEPTGAVAVYESKERCGLRVRLYAAVPEVRTKRGKVTQEARPARAEVLHRLPLPLWTTDADALRAEATLLLAAADEFETMAAPVVSGTAEVTA